MKVFTDTGAAILSPELECHNQHITQYFPLTIITFTIFPAQKPQADVGLKHLLSGTVIVSDRRMTFWEIGGFTSKVVASMVKLSPSLSHTELAFEWLCRFPRAHA